MAIKQSNNEYDYLKKLSLRKISFKDILSSRRLEQRNVPTNDANQVVLVNFTVDEEELHPDYEHPVIGSVRQMAAFLKSSTPITKGTPVDLIKKADNCRKDIKTIANKNKKWVELSMEPFHSLSDFESQAWLVLFKEDYEKIIYNFKK